MNTKGIFSGLTSINQGMLDSSRLSIVSRVQPNLHAREWLIILGVGIITGLIVQYVNFHLKIPGHAILKTVLPISLGISLVPRKSSGTLIAMTGLSTLLILRMAHGTMTGTGALTNLAATGVFLDIALSFARPGWRLMLAFSMAGLVSNLLALVVRGTWKLWLQNSFEFYGWLSTAEITYPACGILAGLLGALLFFRTQTHRPD